ncbi:hypothetical protein CRYUN_Cryun34aG0070500 [Craigia yunnanensis]
MPKTWENPFTITGPEVEITLNRTANSTHPPILNAVEIFMLYNFSVVPTQRNEVILRTSFSQSTPFDMELELLGIEGDNCRVLWELSNNSLEGEVPNFLLDLPDLKLLNLSFNNLRGSVPPELIQKNGRARRLESRDHLFTYSKVASITNKFEKVIGKGGFGTVYYGLLNDNTEVAVKMLSESSNQGPEQFQAEARLLMTVHHKNLTSLIGYCNEGTHMGLIYEYMANGNLEWHLKDRNRNSLGWEQRLKIAIDAAQGLEYLHDGIKPPVVHRDVKSSNILLDGQFHAKLSDFGLSKAFIRESASGITTNVCGTPGYLDPEYYKSERLTKQNDVYSFGVVLLEMITGQSAIVRRNNENIILVKWVTQMLERGDIQNIIDRCLEFYDINSVWKAVDLAMTCVSSNTESRPNMNSIVMDLKACLKMQMAWSRMR